MYHFVNWASKLFIIMCYLTHLLLAVLFMITWFKVCKLAAVINHRSDRQKVQDITKTSNHFRFTTYLHTINCCPIDILIHMTLIWNYVFLCLIVTSIILALVKVLVHWYRYNDQTWPIYTGSWYVVDSFEWNMLKWRHRSIGAHEKVLFIQ